MVIVDDLKWAVNVMLNPGKASSTWKTGDALKRYYGVAIVPMILSVLLFALFGAAFTASLDALAGSSTGAAAGALSWSVIALIILDYLIFIPIGLLIFAWILNFIGKGLGAFKNAKFDATLSALVYGAAPYLVLSWIPFISIIGELWALVVTVFALSNIQRTTKLMAFVTWIIGAIVMGIILVVVFGIAALVGLGAYSASSLV